MPLYNWPYSDLHSLNLDWIVGKIGSIDKAVSDANAAAGQAKASAEIAVDAVENLNEILSRYAKPVFYPDTYITFNSLMDLSAAETYAAFDAYVSAGVLEKIRVGYASAAGGGTDASEDLTRPIWLYRLRNKMTAATGYMTSGYNRPVLLTSAMHGNEKLGTVVMLTLIEEYAHGSSSQIKNLVDTFGVDMIPVLNPYGYDQAIGTTMLTVENNVGRNNARDVDLNRNGVTCWDAETDPYKGAAALSECESKIIHDLAVTNGSGYSFYLDIHTERYNEANHDYFGTVTNGGSLIRSIFSSTMARLNQRMTDYYGYDMLTALNNSSITGRVNRTPMHWIDRCYMLDAYSLAALYEGPRYNNGQIYPVKTQKFTSDMVLNFLLMTLDFLQDYKTIYNSLERDYRRTKVMLNDVLPHAKSAWDYGYSVSGSVTHNKKTVFTADQIDVDVNTYYEVIPSNDTIHWSAELERSGTYTMIDWTTGRQRIFTGTNTKIRMNVAAGDPNGDTVLNLPDLGHDYDIMLVKTDDKTVNIASDLTSSYGTIDSAIMEKHGRLVTIALRMTTTAAISADDDIIEGLPLTMSNYPGINNFQVYEVGVGNHDAYITNADDATSSYVNIKDAITSGSKLRFTVTYFTRV